MIPSNSINESTIESSEHEKSLQENFEYIQHTFNVWKEKKETSLSQLPSNTILELIKPIYQLGMETNEVEKTVNMIQEQLEDQINDDKHTLKRQLSSVTSRLVPIQNVYYKNCFENLKKDIEKLNSKLEDIITYSQNGASSEEENIHDENDQSEVIQQFSTSNLMSRRRKCPIHIMINNLKNNRTEQEDDYATLSHLLIKQMSPAILDIDQNELDFSEEVKEEEETIEITDSGTTVRSKRKVRLSNNVVRWLRGPFKLAVQGMLHAVDVCAQDIHINNAVSQAVKQASTNQEQNTNNSLKPVYVEITSDWIVEGKNADRGFTSPSIWMRDPQGQRVLIKIQDHPLCAANEWLTYALGIFLGLPVNQVQVSIYQNKLVTLHNDVAREDEKTLTLMQLPRHTRKILMTDPAMQCMDIFDHIIQNVDRNQQNILITIPKTTSIKDKNAKFKIHLIDHSSCFGMGKLNIISIVASKVHSKHLSVVTFDPIVASRKFELYLGKLPIADRTLIRKTVNRFASITDEQFGSWITSIQDLLSSGQYNRIYNVLYRQREIVRRYTMQWGISPSLSIRKQDETNQSTSQTNNMFTYL